MALNTAPPLPVHWRYKLDTLIRPCMQSILDLRQQPCGAPELSPLAIEAHCQSLLVHLRELITTARTLGFSQEDSVAIQYALAAFADESAMGHSTHVAQHWMHMLLQVQLFNEHGAGVGFYDRLADLIASPQRHAPLHVYYLCLMFGFQGRYGLDDMQPNGHHVSQHDMRVSMPTSLSRAQWIDSVWRARHAPDHNTQPNPPNPSRGVTELPPLRSTRIVRRTVIALGIFWLLSLIAVGCMRLHVDQQTQALIGWMQAQEKRTEIIP